MQQEILEEQINAVVDAIADSQSSEGGKATIKQLEKQKERMQTRQYLRNQAFSRHRAKSPDYANVGTLATLASLRNHALYVDESHEFKNLAFSTTMNVSGLGNIAGSAKALELKSILHK